MSEEAWPEEVHDAPLTEHPKEEAKPEPQKAGKPAKPAKAEAKEPEETVTDDELEEVPLGSVRPPAEEEARRKAQDRRCRFW